MDGCWTSTCLDKPRNIFVCAHCSFAFPEVWLIFAVSNLPEDEWFNGICQEAIERLSGKPKAINGDRELNSPTASISAQSISSVRSHGSS